MEESKTVINKIELGKELDNICWNLCLIGWGLIDGNKWEEMDIINQLLMWNDEINKDGIEIMYILILQGSQKSGSIGLSHSKVKVKKEGIKHSVF